MYGSYILAVLCQVGLGWSSPARPVTLDPITASVSSGASNSFAALITAGVTLMHQQPRRATSDSTTSICGYLNGKNASALSCLDSAFPHCNELYGLGVWGCCDRATPFSGLYTATSCDYHSACVSSNYIDLCDEACQGDTHVLKCTNSNAVWCETMTMGDLSSFTCNSDPYSAFDTLTLQRIPPTSVDTAGWRTTTYTHLPGPMSTVVTNAQTVAAAKHSYVMGSEELVPHTETITAAVVGGITASAILGVLACFFWLRRSGISRKRGIEYTKLEMYSDT